MPSGEAQEPLKQNTPLSMGTPSFIPNQEGVTNPQQQEIRDRDSEVAPGGKRGGAARVLGETPAPLQPPRVEGAAETCLPPLFPGRP